MNTAISYDDSLLLLDSEFDGGDALPRQAAGHDSLWNERAWDDQLDNGEEMSL